MICCDICNRVIKKKLHINGYCVCMKHYHQFKNHGKFLDSNPRTNNDLNDYRIDGNVVYFNLYNTKSVKVAEFLIDLEDIERIKYHKWRVDTNNRVITGNCTESKPRKELSWVILNFNDSSKVIDHINGNTLDNRKCNLRVCTQAENVCNKSFMSNNTSGFIGVSYSSSRKRWCPEIRKDFVRYHLGRYRTLEEAVYVRYIAEQLMFGEYRHREHDEDILKLVSRLDEKTKSKLYEYTIAKLNKE